MALQKSVSDPTGVTDVATAYVRLVEINLNFADEVGRITLNVYRDAASRQAGKPPIAQFGYSIDKTGRAAVAEVKDESNNVVKQGDPGFPSFSSLMSANQAQIDAIKAAVYNLVKTQKELVGATDLV